MIHGYPATDPVRDCERQSCREIEFEAARLSRLEGRAVDQFGFAVRRTVATKPATVKDGQRRRKERLQIARWSNKARADWAAKKECERRAALESFEVPPLRELMTVCELFPEEAARLFRWRNKREIGARKRKERCTMIKFREHEIVKKRTAGKAVSQ